jgi:hypothetical protein
MTKRISAILLFFIIIIGACRNTEAKQNAVKINENTLAKDIDFDAAKSIVGTWTVVAFDFNLDGKTEPSGNWKYNTQKELDDAKKAGLDADNGNFTFKANGKGYIGKKDIEEMAFTYKKLANGKYVTKGLVDDNEPKNTNAENVELFYLDAKGQLIYYHSSKPLILGKYVIQNSFELYKRK